MRIRGRRAVKGKGGAILFSLLILLFLLPSLHAYLHPLEAPHLQAVCKIYGHHFQAGPSSPWADSIASFHRDCGEAPAVISSFSSSLLFFHPLGRSPPL